MVRSASDAEVVRLRIKSSPHIPPDFVPAEFLPPKTREARARVKRFRIRWAVPLCRWLGAATGRQHRGGCGQTVMLEEHVCLNESRRKLLQRAGEIVYAKCTPTGTCAANQIIQPCGNCPLYRPQLLLSAS